MTFNYQLTETVDDHTTGENLDINFTWDYLDEGDIEVFRTNTSGTPLELGTNYNFQLKKRIRILSGIDNVPDIEDGHVFIVRRNTKVDNPYITYASGSPVRAEDLNDNQKQVLYSAQEREERSIAQTGGTVTGDLNIEASSIIFEGATSNDHETTITAKDPTGDATITVPNLTGHIAILAADPGDVTISSTPTELNKVAGYTGDHTDLNKIEGVTNGTVTASKAVVVDANKDIDGFRNISGATGTFSSNVSVATPTADGHAATKAYVDTVLNVGISDGDKGDISVSGTGTTWTIDNGAVSLAKQTDLAANSIIGNNTADAATPLALTVADVQTLLNVADGANAYSHPNHGASGNGDATSSADGDITINNDAVTYAKMQNVSATNKLLGRSSAEAGDVEEIDCTQAGRAILDDASAADQRTTLAAAGTSTVNTFSKTQSGNEDDASSDTEIDMSLGNFIKVGSTNPTGTPTNLVIGTSGVFHAESAAPTSWNDVFKHPAGLYTQPTSFPAMAPWYIAASDKILVGSWTQGIV